MQLLAVVIVCFVGKFADANGAGRAFPIASENYVIEVFQRINPKLEWDPTNFLVDLSGHYANCRLIASRGPVTVERLTQEGSTIVAYIDYTDGSNVDVNAVNGYLTRVIDRWAHDSGLTPYIRSADRFGCSVRPGCSGQVAVSCLFSPASSSGPDYEPESNIEPGNQKALAFTEEQYALAESITKIRWDRSHFLENLSGFETDCAMIGSNDWQFTKARTMAKSLGLRLLGNYGFAQNSGSTPNALVNILQNIKQISRAKRVGCSLIPDCISGGQMYVVMSCIYEEF